MCRSLWILIGFTTVMIKRQILEKTLIETVILEKAFLLKQMKNI